ncbi:MAG TPA: hypothetical protein VFS43_20270 [Polyangiaceae bacterium]|nr:hypothetical protein [Polyangiaceae bacterium]
MNPKKPLIKEPSSLPEDDRPTLPDINLDDVDEDADTLPRLRRDDDIGSVQRPPSDS